MAEYLAHLYIGKTAAGMEKKIRRAVEKGKTIDGIRLITLSSNGTDQLDILPLHWLKQKALRESLPVIAGFANGREEALRVVAQMVTDAVRSTGKCDLRTWLPEADRDGTLAALMRSRTENEVQEVSSDGTENSHSPEDTLQADTPEGAGQADVAEGASLTDTAEGAGQADAAEGATQADAPEGAGRANAPEGAGQADASDMNENRDQTQED